MSQLYLSLGSNLGNRKEYIARALALLEERVGRLVRRSADFYSEPWGFESANSFLNIAVLVETELSPLEALRATQQIEREVGRRQKSSSGYADRVIDIDLLHYDTIVINTPELTLPHPHIEARDFVRIPLAEIFTSA